VTAASPPTPIPSGGWNALPSASPIQRIRAAYAARDQSDYFFTNVGLDIFLTIITLNIYGAVIFYRAGGVLDRQQRSDHESEEQRVDCGGAEVCLILRDEVRI